MVKCEWETIEDIKNAMKEGISGAKNVFEFGIMNPRRNPIETAVAAIKAGIWSRNFKAAIPEWVSSLSEVTLEDWKSAASLSASLYADRAAGRGTEKWGQYYQKAKATIEAASAELIKSEKKKEDFIKFYESMGKLSEL